jgi:hypothetical protein
MKNHKGVVVELCALLAVALDGECLMASPLLLGGKAPLFPSEYFARRLDGQKRWSGMVVKRENSCASWNVIPLLLPIGNQSID